MPDFCLFPVFRVLVRIRNYENEDPGDLGRQGPYKPKEEHGRSARMGNQELDNKLNIYLLSCATPMFFNHELTSYMHGCTLNFFIHGVESNRDNAHVICFVIV